MQIANRQTHYWGYLKNKSVKAGDFVALLLDPGADKQRVQFINLISDKIAIIDKLPLEAHEKAHVKHVFGNIKAHYEEKTALQLIQNRLEESTYAGQHLAKNGIILLLNNPTSAIKRAPNRREAVKNTVVDLLDHTYKEFTP